MTHSIRSVTEPDLDVADLLGHQLVRFLRLANYVKARFANSPDGSARANYSLLAALVQHGPMRISALADAVHCDPSTVSRQVGALVGQGLLERRADPDDGRVCLLAITLAGARVFADQRRERNEHLARLLHDWPEPQRRQLVSLIERFNQSIERYEAGRP